MMTLTHMDVHTVEEGVCKDARIALGAVASTPMRAKSAEKNIIGRFINEDTAANAAEPSVSSARPLSKNVYNVQILKTLVNGAIIASNNI